MEQQKNKNMKKIALVASLATIGFAFSAFIAPKASTTDGAFEGVVTYSVNTDNAQATAMVGTSMKVYLKGDKAKTTNDGGMLQQITITDKKTPNDPIMLMEVMGNKYQLKNDKTKKEDTKTPDIKYLDDTKTIAGYLCHKAEITVTEQGQSASMDIYYTEALPAYAGSKGEFKGLKGFPLEYSLKTQGISITFSATKVDKQAVSDDAFAVPTGYKLMTMEEMQADLQKNSGAGN